MSNNEHAHVTAGWRDIEKSEIARILFVALAAAAGGFRAWEPFDRISLIGIIGALIGGYPIYHEALESAFERRMTMELSMTIAIAAAVAISEFFTALVIIAFVLIAEILEDLTVGRGRRAIHDLLDLIPSMATVRREGRMEELHSAELRVGDVVVVKPGSRLSVDGRVVRGHSFVDQ